MVNGVLSEIEGFVEIAQVVVAVARWRDWTGWAAVGGVVVVARRGGVELVVDAGEGGQVETTLDELEDGGVFVELAGDVATLSIGRDDQRWHAKAQAVGVQFRPSSSGRPEYSGAGVR